MANSSTGTPSIYNSIAWKVTERICSQGVNLLVQIVLARLLAPSDFGSLAILMAITTYASLFVQSGLVTAIVQKKDLDQKDINTLFTASILVAFILYVTLFLFSPFLAGLYNAESLIWPLRVIALILFLNAINAIQTALLSRNFQFKQIFYRSIIAVPVSGAIGVLLAYVGFGIWALVIYTILQLLLTVIVMAISSSHKLRFEFCWDRAKRLYSFSVKVLFTTLVSGFGDTLRTLLIGKRYSTVKLAYYDKAYTYSSYFTQIINSSISSVLLPTFSRTQDNKYDLLRLSRKSVQLTSFCLIPFLTLIICISKDFIGLFLTEKWLPCVPFLCIFCLLRMPSCISNIDKQVYYAIGNAKIGLYYEICLLILNVIVLLCTLHYGVLAIAIGYLITEIIGCFSLFFVSQFVYGYKLSYRISDIYRPIVYSIIVYITLSSNIFSNELYFIEMIIKIPVGLVLYVILCIITKDQSFKYLITIVINKIIKLKKL